MKKIFMFIDSNNFYKSSEKLVGKKPKYSWGSLVLGIRDLYQNIEPDSEFVRAIYYTALSARQDNPQKYDSQRKFIEAIEKIPYVQTVVGHLMKKPRYEDIPIDISDPSTYYHVEKNTDINLSNDILENAFRNAYNVALLVAADGDFEDTLNRAKRYGIEFYLVLPLGTPSRKLKSLIDSNKIIYLDGKFLERFILK